MPFSYQTPGILVEESKRIPMVISQVETAVPVFIGFTEKAISPSGDNLSGIAFIIRSYRAYLDCYGEAYAAALDIHIDKKYQPVTASLKMLSPYVMNYALKAYFDNGGGKCYIFSAGVYPPAGTASEWMHDDSRYVAALEHLRSIEEITLLVFPDLAVVGEDLYYNVYIKALEHCAASGNRFLIMDIFTKHNESLPDLYTSISGFREKMKSAPLRYGAAYFPNLKTTYHYNYLHSRMQLIQPEGLLDDISFEAGMQLLETVATGQVIIKSITKITSKNKHARLKLMNTTLLDVHPFVRDREIKQRLFRAIDLAAEIISSHPGEVGAERNLQLNVMINAVNDYTNDQIRIKAKPGKVRDNDTRSNLSFFKRIFSKKFTNALDQLICGINVELPPAAAVAGVYCLVDTTLGVWKAPANMVLQMVSDPTLLLDDRDQADLNISNTGISINSIRSFPGRGVLVWGARTLDGNSNEWRYIPVRRFVSMVEASVSKALAPFVYEPNTATTWVKIKMMIENYLVTQWRAGALAGTKADQAFYVALGLNQTMTNQDIIEGRLIVEIGMAVIKPAEFISIKLCQMMTV